MSGLCRGGRVRSGSAAYAELCSEARLEAENVRAAYPANAKLLEELAAAIEELQPDAATRRLVAAAVQSAVDPLDRTETMPGWEVVQHVERLIQNDDWWRGFQVRHAEEEQHG